MKRSALAFFFLFTIVLAPAAFPSQNAGSNQPAPPPQPFETLFYENTDMQVFDLELPAGKSTLLAQNDSLLVSITGGNLSLQEPGQAANAFALPPGGVRFYRGGLSRMVANDGSNLFQAVAVVFTKPRITGSGCSCGGGPTDSICSCPNAAALPADWERQLGGVRLAGVTLGPGATYHNDSNRNTRFLIAITPFDMIDTSIHEPRNIVVRLPAGRFHWLAPGPHTIQNVASQPIQFVCVEFYGTPENSD